MADTPTTRLLLRKQSLGSNTNTWGDTKLNTDLDQLDRAIVGYQAYTVTGDATLSWTNYSTSNDFEVFAVKLTGTPAAACTITVNSTQMRWKIWNACGVTVTIETAAGNGVAIRNGNIVDLICDATDVVLMTSTQGGKTTPTTASNDIPAWSAVEAAIAAAGTLVPATVKVSGTDTTAAFLLAKLNLAVSGALSGAWSQENAGGDENALLTLSVGAGGYDDGGRKTAPFTAAAGTAYSLCSGMTFYLPSAPSDGAKMRLALFNPAAVYGFNPNGKKINNSTSTLFVSGGETYEITYDDTLGDWE